MKQTIETQLDCKATASLQESIADDLTRQDRSLCSIINETNERDKDYANEDKSSD